VPASLRAPVTCTLVAASAACCCVAEDGGRGPLPPRRSTTTRSRHSRLSGRRRSRRRGVRFEGACPSERENLPDATPFQATLPANGVASAHVERRIHHVGVAVVTSMRPYVRMSASSAVVWSIAPESTTRSRGGVDPRWRRQIELLSAPADDTPSGISRGTWSGMHHVAYEWKTCGPLSPSSPQEAPS